MKKRDFLGEKAFPGFGLSQPQPFCLPAPPRLWGSPLSLGDRGRSYQAVGLTFPSLRSREILLLGDSSLPSPP